MIIDKSAKPSRQCVEAQKGNNSAVGTIRCKIVKRVKDAIPRLYKCIVRPQLEYYIQVVIAKNLT